MSNTIREPRNMRGSRAPRLSKNTAEAAPRAGKASAGMYTTMTATATAPAAARQMLGSIRRGNSPDAWSTGSGALIELLDESGFPVPLIVIEYALSRSAAYGGTPVRVVQQGGRFRSDVFDNLVHGGGLDADAGRADALRGPADVQADHRHREEHGFQNGGAT